MEGCCEALAKLRDRAKAPVPVSGEWVGRIYYGVDLRRTMTAKEIGSSDRKLVNSRDESAPLRIQMRGSSNPKRRKIENRLLVVGRYI